MQAGQCACMDHPFHLQLYTTMQAAAPAGSSPRTLQLQLQQLVSSVHPGCTLDCWWACQVMRWFVQECLQAVPLSGIRELPWCVATH